MTDLPTHAAIIVIGGGIVGCSTAYHLAKEHKANVLVLERGKVSSGSSWHAAGLVGQLRSSASVTRLLKYSVELYARLEAETGQATGWKQNGGLRLACNAERWVEIKRQATTARSFGLDMQLMTPAEAQKLWPLMTVDDLVGAAFLPTDGQANPGDITAALAKGARQHGVTFAEGIAVTGFVTDKGRVTGVVTDQGTVTCEKVVLCAGLWSRAIGALAGVNVPIQPMQHQYLITERIEGVTPSLPTLRDPDRLCYYKEEVGGLVMGGYEPNPKPWEAPEGKFEFQLLNEDWDHFEPIMKLSLGRVPALEKAGVKQLLNGPESFTPDGMFILGEAPELENFFVGCGFNAFGIASAGGAGMALAHWAASGEQPMDLWVADIRRFGGVHNDYEFVRARTTEAYGKHYAIVFPHEEYASGRPMLTSPLYNKLAAAGGVFGSKLGWERVNWFAPDGTRRQDAYAMGRQNWFEAVGEEHKAVRERAGLFDQSSFAKFELKGPGAADALAWVCANNCTGEVGRLWYTQLLNSRGGIECDLVAARLAEDHYYIVTGTGFRTHDFAWLQGHMPPTGAATLTDVTQDWGVLSLFGPHARAILASVTHTDVSNTGFPFANVRELEIAKVPVRALRITYVGEQGWELHIPRRSLAMVYAVLQAAGEEHGLTLCGYRAIESLRLEKAYRAWGSDITPNDTPHEAGLGSMVRLKGARPFLGRRALVAVAGKPLTKRLMTFACPDSTVVLTGRETILRDGQPVGYLTSGGWGYTLATNIGLGYVRREEGVTEDFLTTGRYELEVASERVPATLHDGPLYDPDALRVRN
jgi:sarcosine dehydrogenase